MAASVGLLGELARHVRLQLGVRDAGRVAAEADALQLVQLGVADTCSRAAAGIFSSSGLAGAVTRSSMC